MSKTKRQTSDRDPKAPRVVYSEFGNSASVALERAVPDLPPEQQQLRVQVSKKGRKGKTVTIVSGFQCKPETLEALLKQLKTSCGAGGTTKDASLEIQGEHRDKIVEKLNSLGYKAR